MYLSSYVLNLVALMTRAPACLVQLFLKTSKKSIRILVEYRYLSIPIRVPDWHPAGIHRQAECHGARARHARVARLQIDRNFFRVLIAYVDSCTKFS